MLSGCTIRVRLCLGVADICMCFVWSLLLFSLNVGLSNSASDFISILNNTPIMLEFWILYISKLSRCAAF